MNYRSLLIACLATLGIGRSLAGGKPTVRMLSNRLGKR